MITTTYNYSSGTGFVYDATKVGFVAMQAELLLQTNPLSFSPTVSSSTYDHSILQYTSGTLNQINQAPANSTFYASWASQLDGDWGNGSLTVTPTNGAAISGGYLDLTGATNKYVTFSGLGNADSLQVGAVKFKVTPNYSGTPLGYQIFTCIFSALNTNDNLIELYQAISSGSLQVLIANSTGGTIASGNLGVWSPTAGTEYEFELDWDLTSGATRLFIDGVQLGSTVTGTGTRTGAINYVRVGTEPNAPGADNPDFKIRELIFFSTVQHTANYTPGYAYSNNLFEAATANLPPFSYAGAGSVSAFTSFASSDINGVQYTLGGKYWNGTAWVASNGSYAQSNTVSLINAHIATFTPASSLQINALYPNSNSSSAALTSVTLAYNESIYSTSNPTIAPNTSLAMDSLSVFSSVQSSSGSDGVQFYLMIGASRYWWTGTAWATSNGTYAQSNIAADIQAHASTLPIALGAFVTPVAVLHSATGATTPALSSLTITYGYFGPEPTPPTVCTVFGYIVDESENPVVGAIVTVQNPQTFINSGIIVAQGQYTTMTDAIGYFDIDLVETASLTGINYNFSVVYPYPTSQNIGTPPNTFNFGKAAVPNAPSANLATLTFS